MFSHMLPGPDEIRVLAGGVLCFRHIFVVTHDFAIQSFVHVQKNEAGMGALFIMNSQY